MMYDWHQCTKQGPEIVGFQIQDHAPIIHQPQFGHVDRLDDKTHDNDT